MTRQGNTDDRPEYYVFPMKQCFPFFMPQVGNRAACFDTARRGVGWLLWRDRRAVPDLAGAAFVNVPIYFALILTVVSGADCPTLNRDCLRDI